MTDQLDRIEQLGKDILHRLETDVTNQKLVEEIRDLHHTAQVMVEGIVGQMTTLMELITQGGDNIPQPEPPQGGSIFDRTETRWVQITYSRNLKVPRVKNGKIVYSPNMAFTMPPGGQRKKFKVGDRVKVYRPHVQGNGTRLYEVVEYPGNFLMDRDIFRT